MNAEGGVNRDELRGWSMYSWANHGWETTVSTVLIGPWLLALATAHRSDKSTLFSIAGLHLRAESLPSAVITLAAVLQVFVLPPIGIAVDHQGSARRLLRFACIAGSLIAAALAITSGSDWVLAAVMFVVGSLLYGASNVIYNSFLPRIAGPGLRDDVSSRGFAFGYVGGGLLLAVNLLLLLLHSHLGLAKATAVRICFCSAGLWWAGFGVRAIRLLPGHPAVVSGPRRGAWQVLKAEFRTVLETRSTAKYLLAYLLFADAISAVIGLSSTFITHELFGNSASRASTFLFELILMIQFVAMAGAFGFGRLARRIGAKRALLASLVIWCLVIVFSYVALHNKAEAVVAGVAIGLVLGGSQALARSLWSQLIPPGREATYFGLYEIANEGTSWIAPLLFTVVVNITGSFRQAILSLLVLFVAGGLLLAATDLPQP